MSKRNILHGAVATIAILSVAGAATADEQTLSFGLGAGLVEYAPPDGKGGGGGGGGKPGGGGGGGGGDPLFPYYQWMHSDLPGVWDMGFTGDGQTITFIDNFDPTTATLVNINLDMDNVIELMAHGDAVRAFSQFVSPEATLVRHQYDPSSMPVFGAGLDVINLSFGLATESGNYEADWIEAGGHILEAELIRLAFIDTTLAGAEESAVIVKAGGNGGYVGQGGEIGTRVGGDLFGFVDVLGHDLIGAPNVIFAGALDANGTIHKRRGGTGTLASYSDHPGNNLVTREQYLVVGVDASLMEAAGTSFAAPIISSYAAILGDKFMDENGVAPGATQVVDRLLDTARTDTIRNYDPYYHGQGEASIANAVAPDWIVGN